jgi:hypothetical protein
MSKQLLGIRENLHYYENSAEDNLNAVLPRLAGGGGVTSIFLFPYVVTSLAKSVEATMIGRKIEVTLF